MSEIECGTLQDRMPEVASGASAWSAGEAAHIASCGECGPEWEIVQTARRLGGSAARQIDGSRIAGNVVAALRVEKKKSRVRRASWISGLTAAAVVLVVLRMAEPRSRRAAEPPDTTIAATTPLTGAIPMAELESLDADQLEAVLEQLDAAAGSVEGGSIPSMGDLDDQQLERVLRSLEG